MTRLSRKADSIFLDPPIFLSLLDKGLAGAERYNHFVSILLFKPEGLAKSEQRPRLDQLAQALGNNVRKSDYVGSIKEGTLGIILSHTGIDSAGIVLERLRFEAIACLSGGPQEIHLKTSYAVCPSEANLLESLCDLAIQRLRFVGPS